MTPYRPIAERSALSHWWARLCVGVRGRSGLRFRSNEELFAALRAFIAELERSRHDHAAAALREGFGCLNGLTDGWGSLLDAIEGVQASIAKRLTPEQRAELRELRDAVRLAVYRS